MYGCECARPPKGVLMSVYIACAYISTHMHMRAHVVNTLQEARLPAVLSDSESLGVPEAWPHPQTSARTREDPDLDRDLVMVSLGISVSQTRCDPIWRRESHKGLEKASLSRSASLIWNER